VCGLGGGAATMDFPWLDLPFTFLTLLLATRLAYDYYGYVAATIAGSFSLQIFLFYCFARWYSQTMRPRTDLLPSTSRRHDDGGSGATPVLTPLLETTAGAGTGAGAAAASGTLLANRCLAFVFMVFVPLIIVIFEQSQADVLAYGLCLANIVVMVVWLSPDSAASLAATKSLLTLSDDEEEDDGSGGAEDKTSGTSRGAATSSTTSASASGSSPATRRALCAGRWSCRRRPHTLTPTMTPLALSSSVSFLHPIWKSFLQKIIFWQSVY
jgi:hypothetical protein